MYQPKAHQEIRLDKLHDLIRAYPLGCLVTVGQDGLSANHIPFLIDPTGAPNGTLRAHVALANPVWQDCQAHSEALVIFQGPDAYISPTWYPSKHETAQAVPTWNYATVHAYGPLQIHNDAAWIRRMVTDLTDTHERSQQLPWKINDAPQDYIDKMIAAIVGIEMPISRLEGKWKVSQNRSNADRLGVAAGLQSKQNTASHAVAELVLKAIDR